MRKQREAQAPEDRDPRSLIPQVSKILEDEAVRRATAAYGPDLVTRAIDGVLENLRTRAKEGNTAEFQRSLTTLGEDVFAACARHGAPSLRRVINATGVVVHTNLGRSPLGAATINAIAEVAAGYSNLEFDLVAGERGHRETHAESRLRSLLDVESSVVVNNNAAAVLLAVNTFAEGRDVIVSRGELVEIGGSFRIPDIIRKGGARLVEVGTTNKTRLDDYKKAMTPSTGLILRVHPSNFRVVGYTESPSDDDIARFAREQSIPFALDLGSGQLTPLPAPLEREATLAAGLQAGVDVVTASGDKLLGGPQSGLAVGRKKYIDEMRRNPLYRALRVDKLTIAALDAVLALHETGQFAQIPTQRMLREPADSVRERAKAIAHRLSSAAVGLKVTVVPLSSMVGGGAAPDTLLPSFGLSLEHPKHSAQNFQDRLRSRAVPVIARVKDDVLLLDCRTILPGEEETLLASIAEVIGGDGR